MYERDNTTSKLYVQLHLDLTMRMLLIQVSISVTELYEKPFDLKEYSLASRIWEGFDVSLMLRAEIASDYCLTPLTNNKP